MTGSTAVSTVVMRFKNEELVYFQLNYVGDKAGKLLWRKLKRNSAKGGRRKKNLAAYYKVELRTIRYYLKRMGKP
jgi:hypothetical protein